jgi:hypothetical protein
MKAFAIVTACVLAVGGGSYYFHSCDTCPLTGNPIAKTGGCCGGDHATSSCQEPCPACSADCLECCAVCESCCEAGASVPTTAVAKVSCCAEAESCCADAASPAAIATSAAIAGVTLK